MPPIRALLTLATAGALLVAGGCGDSGDEPRADQAIKVRGEPSSPPTVGSDDLQTSFPEIALEFDDLPDVSSKQQAALKAFINFKRGLQQTTREVKVSPLLKQTASDDVLKQYAGPLKYLRENDKHYGGTRHITSVKVAGSADKAIGFGYCTDATELTIVTAGKSAPVEGPKKVPSLNTLTFNDGRWIVTEDRTLDETC